MKQLGIYFLIVQSYLIFGMFFFNHIKNYYTNTRPTKKQIMLGFPDESLLLNLLVIIAKNYIFKCKVCEQQPNIIEVKHRIRKYMSVELYIGHKNDILARARCFWAPFHQIFPQQYFFFPPIYTDIHQDQNQKEQVLYFIFRIYSKLEN